MLAWTARLLAAVAMCLSAYLWWTSATSGTAIGCDFTAFDCDAALASRWAKWFGVPVAAGGTLCYAAALGGAVLAGLRGAAAAAGWRLMEFAAPLAVGGALWFIVIQATQLEGFCLWCLATHACGLAMAAVMLAWRRKQGAGEAAPLAPGLAAIETNDGPPSLGLPTIAAVAGVVALALGQTIAAPSTVVAYEAELTEDFEFTETSPPPPEATPEPIEVTSAKPVTPATPVRRADGSRKVSLLKGRVVIDAYDHPVIGSPEAPHLVVELMDYACPHCREFHDKLTEAIELFDGQVGVVVMPVPGEIICNKLVKKARPNSAGACYAAKLSIAVSQLAPSDFERFHSWMLEAERIPSRTSSLLTAQRYIDADVLSRELRDPDKRLANRIEQYIKLASAISRNGRYGLPSQVLGDTLVAGPPESLEVLCDLWAKAFGLALPPGIQAP